MGRQSKSRLLASWRRNWTNADHFTAWRLQRQGWACTAVYESIYASLPIIGLIHYADNSIPDGYDHPSIGILNGFFVIMSRLFFILVYFLLLATALPRRCHLSFLIQLDETPQAINRVLLRLATNLDSPYPDP